MPQLGGHHLYYRGPASGYGVGGASAFVAVDVDGDVAGSEALQGEFRHIARYGQTQGYALRLDGAVGEILNVLRAEEIVSRIAQGVGYAYAFGREGVGRVALSGHHVCTASGQGVDFVAEECRIGQKLDGVEQICRAGIDGVEYLGLAAVAL